MPFSDPLALRDRAVRARRAVADLGTGSFGDFEPDPPGGSLDPIPLTIAADEWATVGRALEQRAKVLELIVDDLFGPQRLLAGGHLPTAAILAHGEYLRQCVGISSPGAHRLVLYAADLARSATGDFTVLTDRTQMPAGIGTAVQHREVMGRVGPEALRSAGVLPIEDWLAACRRALGELAPPEIDQPRIVMMTPGASAAAHAEHADLARRLGFTLVEPSDLTVADARLWLRSVAGREPVHVVMRLVPSPDCDPLELGIDTVAGVPGLVEACRRDNVAIANPLGSGVGECAALTPFMGRLTRTLLGEDPLIGSGPTWWCGDATGRSHVLANLDRLLIRSPDPAGGRHTRFGRLMSAAERSDLAKRIEAAPHCFVGQEEIDIARQPSLAGDQILDRPTVTRAFLVRDRDGYRCMPGGLTLTDDRPEALSFASFRIGKDTWVTGPTAGGVTGLTGVVTASVPVTPIDLRSSITSRAAGSMYRIGRNLERSHALIRLGRAVGLPNDTRHDLRDLDDTWWATVDRLVNTVAGDASSSSPVRPPATTSALVAAALTDRGRARSLATSLHCLLENAASVRELFSADSWRLLSWIDQLKASLADSTTEDAIEVGTSAVTPLLALAGLVNDSMVRDPGWRFLDIGRRIEGASLVATMLGATLVDGVPRDVDGPFLEVVLDTWDGLGAYRRRYTGDIDPALVVDLLVTDESNPRSVRSHLAALAGDVGALPGPADRHAAVIASASALGALVASANPTVLAETDESGHRPRLGTLTSSVVSALDELATQIDLGYFVQVSSRLFSEVRAPAGVVANGAS